jgi:hypothetical protein
MARYSEKSKAMRVPFPGNWVAVEQTTLFALFFLSFFDSRFFCQKGERGSEKTEIFLPCSEGNHKQYTICATRFQSLGISPTCRPFCSLLSEEDTKLFCRSFPDGPAVRCCYCPSTPWPSKLSHSLFSISTT